ncbi:ribulose-phosphate 3-epimerase [Lactobacillus colini]|uniref:Ribulose-phosphate 3-epimerase n=1 Tax=Lactobacillus colini TaxID=1819254 RepID=A0ABS4MG54_9LACO|nr:ribulose-phosphate 3-epimerase [Lactobacillus colini]MBP2058679.1 ribulose-phosphate 3-epimerase [Lactobacillus colini]
MVLILSPSMMCAKFSYLSSEVDSLNKANIDIYHMDVMDGRYVPNFALGPEDISTVRKNTNKKLDVHLMIENPRKYVKFFSDLGADIIYFCPDAEQQSARTIDDIHAQGKKAGIAVNTGTSFETVKELLPEVDYVLVMTVHPGFASQPFQESVIPKLRKFAEEKEKYGYILGIDGAVSRERIKALHKLGVDNFVLGTSALFGKEQSYKEIISDIRKEN